MPRRTRVSEVFVVLASLLALVLPQQLGAQVPAPEPTWPASAASSAVPPLHLVALDGDAWLRRDTDAAQLEDNEPLLDGDVITTRDGRLSAEFGDGSRLSLDADTEIEILSDSFVRLEAGRLALTVDRRALANRYRVDVASAVIWLRSPGDYRVWASAATGEARVHVLRGQAEVATARERALVDAGFEAVLDGSGSRVWTAPTPVTRVDSFERWMESQTPWSMASGTYLPTELRTYASTLNASGDWRHEAPYGYVWYPRVSSDWYPYSVGRWTALPSYGWMWVGRDRWSWPTHHYGRWRQAGARWFWIPGRVWAPAWVSWAVAPGYVAWCPIDDRHSVSFTFGSSYTSIGFGWSIVPDHAFRARRVVASRGHIPVSVQSLRFARRDVGPAPIDVRVGRPQPRDLSGPRAQPRASTRPVLPAPVEPRRPGVIGNAPRGGSDAPAWRSPAPRAVGPADGSPRPEVGGNARAPRSRAGDERTGNQPSPRDADRLPSEVARPRPRSGEAAPSRPPTAPPPPPEPRSGVRSPRVTPDGPSRPPDAPRQPRADPAPRSRGGEAPSGRATPRTEAGGNRRSR